MPIDEAKKNRSIRTLLNDTFLQAEQVMRNACKEYRKQMSLAALSDLQGDPQKANAHRAEAYNQINRVVITPYLRRQRITDLVAYLANRLGTQAAAVAWVDDALTKYGVNVTRQELMTHLNALVVIADAVIAGNVNGTWTLDQVADYVEANTQDDDPLYAILETTMPVVPDLVIR